MMKIINLQRDGSQDGRFSNLNLKSELENKYRKDGILNKQCVH